MNPGTSHRTNEQVHHLVGAACERHADQVAIVTPTESLRFSDLATRVATTAANLHEAGVGKGDVVGVVGHRSASLIIGVLAGWTAGAVVTLVDDQLPAARREAMLDSGPTRLTIEAGEIKRRTTERPPLNNPDYAYVAFTSGSTGRPKPILGSHAGLTNFLRWQSREFCIGPRDRFAHLTNPSFDVWFRDALTPLVSGAALYVPDEGRLDSENVVSFLDENEITGVHTVPSLAAVWTSSEMPSAPTLRLAFFAGETLHDRVVRRWREVFPTCTVVNLYGPTETTLAQHFHRIGAGTSGIQPVGRNIPGSTTYLLDEHQRVCPTGRAGEVFIAADHPAHGYLVDGRPVSHLTRITFDGNEIDGYRTGDYGRRNQYGELEIIGRGDDQVKIAGVRIDLHEIRSAIMAFQHVHDAFVCAVDRGAVKILVAIVAGCRANELVLREHMRESLMALMVPSIVIFKADLPKLPNGKVDRRALRDLATETLADSHEPRYGGSEDIESKLARVWMGILGRDARTDLNFFEAGGNSYTVTILQADIEREFGLQIPLVRLFEHPSFAAQRSYLQAAAGATNRSTQRMPSRVGSASRHRVLSSRRPRRSVEG